MTDGTTTLERPISARGEWARCLAFLKRPSLPRAATGFNTAALNAVLRLVMLDFAIMGGLMVLAVLAAVGGFTPPDNSISSLEWNAGVIAAIVVIAPLLEEIAFRSWLSGKAGHVMALLGGTLVFAMVTVAIFAAWTGPEESMGRIGPAALIGALAGLACAILFLVKLRGRPPMRWFEKIFPALFWLSTLAFALAHLFNYTEGSAVLLLLVVPQFISGAIFGYARVQYGLWASVLMHILHNGAIVALVSAGLTAN